MRGKHWRKAWCKCNAVNYLACICTEDELHPRAVKFKDIEPQYRRFCSRVNEIRSFMTTRLKHAWGARNYAFGDYN